MEHFPITRDRKLRAGIEYCLGTVRIEPGFDYFRQFFCDIWPYHMAYGFSRKILVFALRVKKKSGQNTRTKKTTKIEVESRTTCITNILICA